MNNSILNCASSTIVLPPASLVNRPLRSGIMKSTRRISHSLIPVEIVIIPLHKNNSFCELQLHRCVRRTPHFDPSKQPSLNFLLLEVCFFLCVCESRLEPNRTEWNTDDSMRSSYSSCSNISLDACCSNRGVRPIARGYGELENGVSFVRSCSICCLSSCLSILSVCYGLRWDAM